MTPRSIPLINRFDGRYAFLSNFWAGDPFEWSGDTWQTAEHAFQAAKAAQPIDYFRIRDSATPGLAKKLGRKVKLTANWDKKKVSVMLDILRAKFCVQKQPAMAQRLVATKDARLVEGNTWGDVFWGVDAVNGVGQNQLGIALMATRGLVAAQLRGVSLEDLI